MHLETLVRSIHALLLIEYSEHKEKYLIFHTKRVVPVLCVGNEGMIPS